MNKMHYYRKGMQHARFCTVAAWGACNSWQRKAFKKGYETGMLYMQAEAMIHGFDNVWDYQGYLIKQTVKG